MNSHPINSAWSCFLAGLLRHCDSKIHADHHLLLHSHSPSSVVSCLSFSFELVKSRQFMASPVRKRSSHGNTFYFKYLFLTYSLNRISQNMHLFHHSVLPLTADIYRLSFASDVHRSLKAAGQVNTVVKKGTGYKTRKVILELCKTQIRPQFEYRTQFWSPHYWKI